MPGGIDGGLPLLLDLLAAALAAGSTPATALTAAVDALTAAVGAQLQPVARALSLGAAPASAWAPLLDDRRLRPLAVAMSRASTSGVRAAALLYATARDARERRRADATEAARRAGVQAVVPLGACFLPAFVLLGIVPTLAGLASAVLGSG